MFQSRMEAWRLLGRDNKGLKIQAVLCIAGEKLTHGDCLLLGRECIAVEKLTAGALEGTPLLDQSTGPSCLPKPGIEPGTFRSSV